jgi:hypothetical protein
VQNESYGGSKTFTRILVYKEGNVKPFSILHKKKQYVCMSPAIESRLKSRRLQCAGHGKDKEYVLLGDFSVETSRNTTYRTEK